MKKLCIVPCGNKKIWDKSPDVGAKEAKHVYVGPFAGKCREYAEKFYSSSWCILSARYGFLFPDDIIPGPYNVSFNDKRSNPVAAEKLLLQAKEKGLFEYEEIIVLGGRNYTEIIKKVFQAKNIYTPLSNCKGIGIMMGKLNEAIKGGLPL